MSGGGFLKLADPRSGPLTKMGIPTNPLWVTSVSSLAPVQYDYISLGYTGANLTSVIFKTGGAGGTTVSTLTLAYTGANLISVTKT